MWFTMVWFSLAWITPSTLVFFGVTTSRLAPYHSKKYVFWKLDSWTAIQVKINSVGRTGFWGRQSR